MSKEEKFIQVIKDNEGIIYKITRVYTNGGADQEDLYQEIVYQLWKGFDAFRGDAKISTWIYRIALNTALYHSKKESRKVKHIDLEGIMLKQENEDPLLEERLQDLYSQIKTLNDLDKGIILLLLEGKKYEEIGEVIGLSTTNIGTRIARIKEKLRTQIIKK